MDGCTATTHIAYALSDVATIYPISPASDMGELADKWSAEGRRNMMGQSMVVKEMESELGAAGALHGSLAGGAMSTTFTASQGLMLMIPNMYKMAGELLPAVFHVTTRSLAAQALSIFGDHQDVMACRHTGFAFLASSSVQECMDLALIAHLSAMDGSLPFCHFFDGMRTSSQLDSIYPIEYEDIFKFVDYDKINQYRQLAMNSEHPDMRGTAQDPDVYFQNKEAANRYYDALPEIVQANMDKVGRLTGRPYRLFDYAGAPDATLLIISMGSSCDVIEEVVSCMYRKGEKVGLIKVRLFRPFSNKHLLDAIPPSVERICVLDRTKEPGSNGEPLLQDVCTALYDSERKIRVIGGRYGLSSKDFTPSMVKAIFDNLRSDSPKARFTIGIKDDVTHLSLPVGQLIETTPPGTIQCKFFGIGSDGTVGANKQAANIIGDNTDLYVQAYFSYDSKKSEGYTISDLRFGSQPIRSAYLITHADYIACHKDSYVHKFDVLDGIRPNGVFVLNTPWTLEQMEKELPTAMKNTIARNKLKFYAIDASRIADEFGLGVRINMIMQTVFFKLSGVMDIPTALTLLKEDIKNIYEKEGDDVVVKNINAVDNTIQYLKEIDYPSSWVDSTQEEPTADDKEELPHFIKEVARPILALKGNGLPVSKFSPNGIVPSGTTKYEKRGVAIDIPIWTSGICIQCTQCSMVCPHAAIRPYLATSGELADAPASFEVIPAEGGDAFKDLSYRIQVYPEDCLGCGSCVNVCPVQALTLESYEEQHEVQKTNLAFAEANISIKDGLLPRTTIKGTQLQQPLLEFSGACAGCGETPYVKLLTQLFGERLIIANATGCSSIWGASMPSMPYAKNKNGHGPAWGNSLFEDAAEYGYGISLALQQRRSKLYDLISAAMNDKTDSPELLSTLKSWWDVKEDPEQSYRNGQHLIALLKQDASHPVNKELLEYSDLLGKKTVWVVGGDGWAYDIGFGGLDHVLASGENINLLVLDTECYSNTGGQTSKATPLGAVAKFSSSGKRTNRKDLGRMMMVYGNVYVASVALGANKQQVIDAMLEAEAYDGPSIVIAYSPCINWGIRKGMGTSIAEEAHAVACGYWPLYRYNPALTAKSQDPLTVDCQKPDGTMFAYLNGEDRYADLRQADPTIADKLQTELQTCCDRLYEKLINGDQI